MAMNLIWTMCFFAEGDVIRMGVGGICPPGRNTQKNTRKNTRKNSCVKTFQLVCTALRRWTEPKSSTAATLGQSAVNNIGQSTLRMVNFFGSWFPYTVLHGTRGPDDGLECTVKSSRGELRVETLNVETIIYIFVHTSIIEFM